MLHGYKKSKYNIYDNLEFLGLNPYEQKHFCFGEGGGESGAGDGIDEAAPTNQAAQDEADEAAGIGIDEAEATNLAGLIDDLAATNNLGALATGYQGISAAAKAADLQAAMDRGDIGYNEAVEAGFVGHVEQAERDFDLSLARSIADKYGLDPSQVQPGFMQDPAYGPQTMSYRGPGALGAAATEVGKAAAELGITLAEMYPSPLNMALTIAKEEGLIDVPSLGLKEGISGYFDELAASQREANMAARGETDPDTAGIIDDFEEETAQQGAFSTLDDAGIIDDFEEEVSQGGLFSAPEAPASFGDIDLDGNEFIPLSPAIPSTPSVAPKTAAEVVRPPVTRTAATDTFSILADIYGPEVAAQLLPNRIV